MKQKKNFLAENIAKATMFAVLAPIAFTAFAEGEPAAAPQQPPVVSPTTPNPEPAPTPPGNESNSSKVEEQPVAPKPEEEGKPANQDSVPKPTEQPKDTNTPVITEDNNNTPENNVTKKPAKPSQKPSKSQLEGIKKLVKKVEDLTKAKDSVDESATDAGNELEALLLKISQTPDVKSLYDYYTSLTDDQKKAYEDENSTVKGAEYKSALEFNGKSVSGQNLFDLRSKKVYLDQAKAKQEAAQKALEEQIKTSVDLFEEVAQLFDNDEVKSTKITDKDTFKTKVKALKAKVEDIELAGLFATAGGSNENLTLTADVFKSVTTDEEATKATTEETKPKTEPSEKADEVDSGTPKDTATPAAENDDAENKQTPATPPVSEADQGNAENKQTATTPKSEPDPKPVETETGSGPTAPASGAESKETGVTESDTGANGAVSPPQTEPKADSEKVETEEKKPEVAAQTGGDSKESTGKESVEDTPQPAAQQAPGSVASGGTVGKEGGEKKSTETSPPAGPEGEPAAGAPASEAPPSEDPSAPPAPPAAPGDSSGPQEPPSPSPAPSPAEPESLDVKLAGLESSVYLASTGTSSNDSTTTTTSAKSADVESALKVVETLLEENASNEKITKTLTDLKAKLTQLKEALAKTSAAANNANTEVAEAEKSFVDFAKEIGLAEADANASTVLSEISKTLEAEASSTTLLASLVAQQQAEALYNQLASEQVLFAKVASAELSNLRNSLRNVRGEAQGVFASFFYNGNEQNQVETSYPALTIGADYQIKPNFKVGGLFTYSTAKFSMPSLNDYNDTSFGVSAFADYAYHNYFVTLLAGYSHHSFGLASEADKDKSYSGFNFTLRGGYEFDFASKGKFSLAGVYQYHNSSYTSLATQVLGLEGDYVYKLDNVDLSAGLALYYQVHSKELVKPANYTQVVASNLYNFSNLYKKSGVGVEVSVGAKTRLDDSSSLGVKASYYSDPMGGRNVNLNFDYRFKF